MTITVIAVVEVITIIIIIIIIIIILIIMLNIVMMMMMIIIRISVYDPGSYWCYLSRSEKGLKSSCLNRIFSSLSNYKDHSVKFITILSWEKSIHLLTSFIFNYLFFTWLIFLCSSRLIILNKPC